MTNVPIPAPIAGHHAIGENHRMVFDLLLDIIIIVIKTNNSMPTPDLVAEICVGGNNMELIAIALVIIFGIICGSLIGRITKIRQTVFATIAMIYLISGIICINIICGLEILGNALVLYSIVLFSFLTYSYFRRREIEKEEVRTKIKKRIDEERKEEKKKKN